MVRKSNEVVKKLELPHDELDRRLAAMLAGVNDEQMHHRYEASIRNYPPDTILNGRVLTILNGEVIVDVGYKSEGISPLAEFGDSQDIEEGDEIEVFLESVEDDS